MKTLFLPGANPKTIEWYKDLSKELSIENYNAHIHRYIFWEENNSNKSVEKEVSQIGESHYDLVVAKSFGTLVLMEVTINKKISWDRAIIFGVPLKIVPDTKFNIAGFQVLQNKQLLTVQQKHDILGATSELEQLQPVNLISIDGKDHQYDEFHLYKNEISKWLTSTL